MTLRVFVNLVLLVACVVIIALHFVLEPRDVTRPNYDFIPEAQMVHSPAFDSFAPNQNFSNGLTLQSPPAGTIARGLLPLHYESTPVDAVRAGEELQNPFSERDAAILRRGSVVFANFCQLCHGATGLGNTPVTQRGFPQTPSLLADRAVLMKDGQMFHVLTYGQGNMPSHAAQLSRDDRWAAILHVRLLQRPQMPARQPGSGRLRIQEVARRYRENCMACHGENGTGEVIRKVLPLIPDFTSLAWQASQTDVAIVNGINYGALPLMPSFRQKLSPRQILELAVYVRTFISRETVPPGKQAALPVTARVTPPDVYRTYCLSCHDSSGRGNNAVRTAMPELPDFTSAAWQKSRTDADLTHSVMEGKGKFMLPMKDKLGSVDVKQMVALIRAFDGGGQTIAVEGPKAPGPAAAVATTDAAVGTAPQPRGTPAPKKPRADKPQAEESSTGKSVPVVSAEMASRIHVGAGIFRQYCIVCHAPDGTGSLMRVQMPPIPDFTKPEWQKERTDSRLFTSILDGKGTLMPANRGRVTETQAHDLVAYIRAFGPAQPGKSDKNSGSETEFDKSFRSLEERWNELQKQMPKTAPPAVEK